MHLMRMLAAAALASSLSPGLVPAAHGDGAGCRGGAATTISAATEQGWTLTLAAGTTGGSCASLGRRIVCRDRDSLAIADTVEGCLKVAGGGRCAIRPPAPAGSGATDSEGADPVDPEVTESYPAPDDPSWPRRHSEVSPANSTVDVECETGAKRGSIYTLEDGDGQGTCGPNRDVDGRVNGGTCTKNGSECGSVDCDHGCGTSSQNCGCRIRQSVKRVGSAD